MLKDSARKAKSDIWENLSSGRDGTMNDKQDNYPSLKKAGEYV